MTSAEYYDNMTADEWKPILGEDLHYHFGFYEDGMSFEEGLAFAVRRLIRFLDTGNRIADIGCGWGGPANVLAEHGYQVTGVTNSSRQHSYCRSLGLACEFLDVDDDDVKRLGHFDAVFMMESLEHVFDKRQFLRRVKTISRRLVVVTNCNAFAVNGSILAFGDTGPMLSVPGLLRAFEDEGWRVRHSCDVRRQAGPTVHHWKRRIDAAYPTERKIAAEMLDRLCNAALQDTARFEASFPLLVVCADA